jgi:uncharacterized protein
MTRPTPPNLNGSRHQHRTIIGMVHLQPLPGTPFHRPGSLAAITDRAVESAVALAEGGADGCLVQTVDRVYDARDATDPARVAAMALIVRAVVEATGDGFAVGVQLMRNAVRASVAVAAVAGASFVRAGAFVGRSVTVHGTITGDAPGVLDYRRLIGAQQVSIVAEIDSRHHRPEPNLGVAELAGAAAAAGADAVVVGHPDGARTLASIAQVRRAEPELPIILAGHTDHSNAADLLGVADGAFVGSCLEQDGWGGRVDQELVERYVGIVRGIEPG